MFIINFQYFENPKDVKDKNFENEITLQLNNQLEKFRTYGLTVKNIYNFIML